MYAYLWFMYVYEGVFEFFVKWFRQHYEYQIQWYFFIAWTFDPQRSWVSELVPAFWHSAILSPLYAPVPRPVPHIFVQIYSYQMARACVSWLQQWSGLGLAGHGHYEIYEAPADTEAYIHAVGICHRDIKPQNLLVEGAKLRAVDIWRSKTCFAWSPCPRSFWKPHRGHTHALKICDFGSAKPLVKGEPNVAYICSLAQFGL